MDDLVARLMRRRPVKGRPFKSDATEWANPDGHPAAMLLQAQAAEITRLKAVIAAQDKALSAIAENERRRSRAKGQDE